MDEIVKKQEEVIKMAASMMAAVVGLTGDISESAEYIRQNICKIDDNWYGKISNRLDANIETKEQADRLISLTQAIAQYRSTGNSAKLDALEEKLKQEQQQQHEQQNGSHVAQYLRERNININKQHLLSRQRQYIGQQSENSDRIVQIQDKKDVIFSKTKENESQTPYGSEQQNTSNKKRRGLFSLCRD